MATAVACGCHPRPVQDLVLADVAFKAATKAKAAHLAPDSYRKAENFLLRALRDYAEGYYDSCRSFAGKARQAAEVAEFEALKKKIEMDKAGSAELEGAIDRPSTPLPPPPPSNVPPAPPGDAPNATPER